MKADRDVFRKRLEILVCCIDWHLAPYTHGTNEKIGIRCLYFLRTAEIEVSCCLHIIIREERKIWETFKMPSKIMELGLAADARKNLLADRSDHLNAMVMDEAAQFIHARMTTYVPTPESQRPNTGIHNDLHDFFLCFL